jgi:hypothetical protein
MAIYVATNTTYPTIGEVIRYVAVTSGLVVTDSTDDFYEALKPFVQEQKGRDFGQLKAILDELERRLEEVIAPPGLGKNCFDVFRRVLENYTTLILLSRTNSWTREQFVKEKLVPDFIVPYAAWLLKNLNREPFDFLSAETLLRSTAPLDVAFSHFLSLSDKSWTDLAELYQGKAAWYGNRPTEHDVEDNKKLIRKWRTGKATPSFSICRDLLDALGLGEYSGFVFWMWVARFLQKVDRRYRLLIADAVQRGDDMPATREFAKRLTAESDAMARGKISADGVRDLRVLTTLLFYNKHRHKGDKARVEGLLAKAKEQVGDSPQVQFYITWLQARYHLYCRDMPKALAAYEQAYYEGMYCDCQADEAILPEWASVAQKAGDRPALKRINSRMKLMWLYPTKMSANEVATLRLKEFHENLGAGLCFHEAFATSSP